MSDRTSRADALVLINCIRNPHLRFNKFSSGQWMYDTMRRPFTTVPTEAVDHLRAQIESVAKVIDRALDKLTPETFEEVLELPQIKASTFGGQATIRRFLRGNGRPEDFVLLSKYLADLRQSLTVSPTKPIPH